MNWTREQEKLERQQTEILRLLAEAGETTEPGEWTAAQHVEHLALADEEAARQAGTPSGERPGRMTWLALPLVCLLLRFGPRVPAPGSLANLEPRADITPDEARAHWAAARAQFQAQMDTLSPADARRVVFRHPVAGPLDAAQTLRLGLTHGEYHRRQLAKQTREAS